MVGARGGYDRAPEFTVQVGPRRQNMKNSFHASRRLSCFSFSAFVVHRQRELVRLYQCPFRIWEELADLQRYA